jgi:hypothetical protein
MTDTKQITFEGREYTVPVWVEWVARDESGCKARGYSRRPIEYHDAYHCVGGMSVVLTLESWRDSLTKV